ncbi:MAG: DUF4995 domain-containing protein [Candidatus Cryptobacteroides sp.]
MNRICKYLVVASAALAAAGCATKEDYSWLKNGIDTAHTQLLTTAERVHGTGMMPRAIWVGYDLDFLARQLGPVAYDKVDYFRAQPSEDILGTLRLCDIYDWTSGFFPGSLWYMYELTGDGECFDRAVEYTNIMYPIREYTKTHDLGFMMNCSYGHALRLAPADSVRSALIQTADNLADRFNGEIGAIRSWDFGDWNYPVIIDNMMNLELLFSAERLTGDSRYREIAIRHANTTLKNHFRPDCTSWHVISYNNDGTVECRQTFQGRSDDSAWARGQAWGVYGYTECYRETSDTAYLEFAQKIADMIMSRVTTADAIPYWDYDAPQSDETPRDASAAAVTACALFELSTYLPDGQRYFDYAEKILKSLSSPDYLAAPGTNEGFVLKHSVGSLAHGSEIDTPLNYADYYYLEAIKRYMALKGIEYKNL